jgi:hypothetical protein
MTDNFLIRDMYIDELFLRNKMPVFKNEIGFPVAYDSGQYGRLTNHMSMRRDASVIKATDSPRPFLTRTDKIGSISDGGREGPTFGSSQQITGTSPGLISPRKRVYSFL